MRPPIEPLMKKTEALLTQFHRQRPVRAGSLLITILGDSIAPRGGQISLASLIEFATQLRLPERLIRTSIGRLAQDDWVTSTRSGRNSYYCLTATGRARFAEATQRIYAAQPPSWSGLWTVVVVRSSARETRETVRQELIWLGFGQIAPGVFVHPLLEERSVRGHVRKSVARDLIILRDARSVQMSDVRLVQQGWDFRDLTRRYRKFIDMFSGLEDEVGEAADISPERAFILRTLLLHEYRKIHLRDPLLPAVLLPARWVGSDALDLCRRIYAQVFRSSEQYLSRTGKTHSGPLPKVSNDTYLRFGGLPR
jgi:phenylacetic acid degradation operon negative regulatory protein